MDVEHWRVGDVDIYVDSSTDQTIRAMNSAHVGGQQHKVRVYRHTVPVRIKAIDWQRAVATVEHVEADTGDFDIALAALYIDPELTLRDASEWRERGGRVGQE